MGADEVDPFDYPIYALADGVHQNRHPTGKGAQLLTRIIKHILVVLDDHKSSSQVLTSGKRKRDESVNNEPECCYRATDKLLLQCYTGLC